MRKLLLALGLLLFVGLPLALGAAVLLCFEDEPLVSRTAAFTPDDVERAMRLFEKHDPRKMRSGTLRTLSIRGEDLDLAVNYLANRYGRGSSRIVLQPGLLGVAASVELPANPLGRCVNVKALMRETSGLPAFEELRIGRLPIPHSLADWALRRALQSLDRTDQHQAAADTIRSVGIADGSVRIVYEWRDDLPSRLSKVVMSPADNERFRTYQDRLVTLTRDSGLPRSVSLTQILAPLMTLAAHAGAPLSDAIGLYKEIDDSRGGSGFSFNDIAADRAGTRFGEIATQSPAGARGLQRRLTTGVRESDLMPETADLPEFMPEAEFKRRFGGIGAPQYQRMMQDIERRIAACPLYR